MAQIFLSKKLYKTLQKERKEIDFLMWVASIVGPLSALPQLVTIYTNKSAVNVSILAWCLFTVISAVGLAYSIVHRIKPLILYYTMWILVDIAIVVGISLYN